MIVPFFVGRERSVQAVETANSKGKLLFITTQKDAQNEEPSADDVYPVGTVARILQMLKLPDGTVRVLVEGNERASLVRVLEDKGYFSAQIKPIRPSGQPTPQCQAMIRTVQKEFARYAGTSKKIPVDIKTAVEQADSVDPLVDLITANIPLKLEQKVELLGIQDPTGRIEKLTDTLVHEIEVLELEKKINTKVRKRLEKTQRQYFLNEQMKEIQKELGQDQEDATGAKELDVRLEEKGLPEEVLQKCLKESKRLARLQPISPESGVLRTYLEWICDLPWKEVSEDSQDIDLAREILDEDHYGLKKVKERILDFIAVRQLKDVVKGPILCFVGPPGTGKTSLGRSVARCLGREFVRISLGGVRDEAEIRGHRKTYIGALPGKILQSMRRAKTINPVFLLDEVDKMNADFRGDPAAALLEVLDPEQNASFVDHYLEVPYDLSHVMFITTANSVHNIPWALRDRMEVIEISGYTEQEKEQIATRFLIPKQIEENGLSWGKVSIQKPAIRHLIRNYTMESGVRNLEREIGNVLRKIARDAVKKGVHQDDSGKESFRCSITEKSIQGYLGKPKYQEPEFDRDLKPGLAYGLAWTEVGGALLPVEIALLKGKGEIQLTGSLGDVMKESAHTALSYLRAHSKELGIGEEFHRESDIHLHVPEGAIPKDGPSAGITITAALLSAVTGRTIRPGHTMTGEITLTGRLLPVGGVKEKILAAHRNGFTHVLLPEQNRKDLEEIPSEVRSALEFTFHSTVAEALPKLLTDRPARRPRKTKKTD
jgi:ATP-dependent Lon protease